jgi:hypothetical protein
LRRYATQQVTISLKRRRELKTCMALQRPIAAQTPRFLMAAKPGISRLEIGFWFGDPTYRGKIFS